MAITKQIAIFSIIRKVMRISVSIVKRKGSTYLYKFAKKALVETKRILKFFKIYDKINMIYCKIEKEGRQSLLSIIQNNDEKR